MKATLLMWVLWDLASPLWAANILIVLPMPFYSHTYTFMPVFKELVARGHNITMVSPFRQPVLTANWTDLIVEHAPQDDESISHVINASPYEFYPMLWNFCKGSMRHALADKTVQRLWKDNSTSSYDLIIMEPYFCQEALITLGHKMNVPIVALHSMSLTPWYAFLTGNDVSLHLTPNIRSSYTYRMSFFERIDNVLINLIEFCSAYYHYIPYIQGLMDEHVTYPGYENRPSLLTMLRNVSLTLLDYHFSVGYPDPLQPNSIPVGGLSIKGASELSKDLKDIMDRSKNGVIYMNMGSFLKIKHFPKEMIQNMIDAFATLEQTVLMKMETEYLPNKPKNVEIRKWYPQPSILAHPNLRVFITHGGLHGMTEAAYFGVPVLCLPFFADQKFNSKFAEQNGFGLTLELEDISKVSILQSLRTMLSDPRYKENAMRRSRIVRDRPHGAVETAAYWVEYVIRHNGAEHLKPAKAYLSLYEVLYVDITLFFAAIITFIVLLIKGLLRLVRMWTATKAKTD